MSAQRGVRSVEDAGRLERAYNDSRGLTARFNRNILTVLTRELRADFVLERFEHVARFDAEHEWIEMLLRSSSEQAVSVRELGLHVQFAAGEEMRTEISVKFRQEGVARELAGAGLRIERCWTDGRGDFLLCLARRRLPQA